ncbi:CGNR zinc finger domain-containing protein [Larkinella insperata]|uniref:CGNR zinc finger domain-containing protein n=1 Tax=Larkinella insperata TaxID=332158 RepID=A0ABW3Q6U1_9BACT
MANVSTITEMDLVGGAACLDFVNTALDLDVPVERLHTYQDLLMLVRRLSLLDEKTLADLERLARAEPEQAERVLSQARQVRSAMLATFNAMVKGELATLQASDLSTFNELISEALNQRRFLWQADQLAFSWQSRPIQLQQAVWVFSWSAYELLTTQDHKLLKQCGACAWLFLDTTKNHRRKWCDMQSCGSHQKARRYYQRKKQA